MPTEEIELGAYIVIALRDLDTGAYHLPVAYWDELDAAFHQYVERGIDRVCEVVTTSGAEVLFPASRIGELSRSTPETRERGRQIAKAHKAEDGPEL